MTVKISQRPYFSVDRRPIFMHLPNPLGCSGDSLESIGWSNRYNSADGLSSFIEEFIRKASDHGARRFLTMFPSGAAPKYGSANIYQPFFESKLSIRYDSNKCELDNPIMIWDNPMATWQDSIKSVKNLYGNSSEFYFGMSLMKPAGGFSDFSSIGSDGDILGLPPNNPLVLSWLNHNASGWKNSGADGIAVYGVNQYFFYNPKTSPSVQSFLHNNLSLKCLGIGVPKDISGNQYRLADSVYAHSPFVVRMSDGNDFKAISGEWDSDKTEIHIIIPSSKMKQTDIQLYFDRGIIPGIEFDSSNPLEYLYSVEMLMEMYYEIESRRISKSARNMTVFSMAAGDNRDASGNLDNRFSSIIKSKANLSANIIPVVRINCSSSKFPSDPYRNFIPSWWWSNSKSQCIDPSMSSQCLDRWMIDSFDKKMVLVNYKSPYGTTGPEKCADALFDTCLYYISKYNALKEKPFNSSYDLVVSLENWGGGKYMSEKSSAGLVDGECRFFGHQEDAISGDANYPPLFDLASPFFTNGIAECVEWFNIFMKRLLYRRSNYALNTSGSIPPLPSKFLFNNMDIVSSSHMFIDKISSDEVVSKYGMKLERQIENFYGAWNSLLKDPRFNTFNFGFGSLYDKYIEYKSSATFDVDAVLPDSRGSLGTFGLDQARTDRDYLFYQPNAPARMWFDSMMKEVTSYGIDSIFKKSVRNFIPGIKWLVPDVTVLNNGNKRMYKLGSPIGSEFICLAGKNLSFGGISSPSESRMHISKLVMPGIHSAKVPSGSNIVCFDMLGSGLIRDGSFMPIWGAGYNRPLVGVSGNISSNDDLNSIPLSDDRSFWADSSGSVFSSKDATSSNPVKSGKPIKNNYSSNNYNGILNAMSTANVEANKNNLEKAAEYASTNDIEFVPIIKGTALSDTSWSSSSNIGDVRSGYITGHPSSGKYKVDSINYSKLINAIFSKGCRCVIHYPDSHIVNDWNAIDDIVGSINSYAIDSVNPNVPINDVSDQVASYPENFSSYAMSISYDYQFAINVMQVNARPSLRIDADKFIKDSIFVLHLLSANGSSRYNFKSFPIQEMRVVDLVNMLNRQDGVIAKVMNGNSNVMVRDLVISDYSSNSSGWIFMSIPDRAKSSPVSSEARSRPFDYIRIKNTSIDPVISQKKSSMSFGGFVVDDDAFGFSTFKSPVYISSEVAQFNEPVLDGEHTFSSNGEIFRGKKLDEYRMEIVSRGMFGTRKKMHLPGDYAISVSDNAFDDRFGTSGDMVSQYRCFALKNVSKKHICHDIQFDGVSTSSASKIQIAIEIPSIMAKNINVFSAGKNFVQSLDLNSSMAKNSTLVGTLLGLPLPGGGSSYRVIDHVEGNKLYLEKPMSYVPSSNTYVECMGSRAGYSAGGLFYPSLVGNYISEFYNIMSGDSLSLDKIISRKNILKPGELVYMWIRRIISPGSRSIDSGNFMPKVKFEVS